MNPSPKSPSSRLLFLDWLRAWALLVMVETHVSNAFLSSEIRAAGWFGALNFFNGLVAPSFLFVSGFVFLVAAQKRLEELRRLGRPFWRQVGRVGMVWAIGYLMHLFEGEVNPFLQQMRTNRFKALLVKFQRIHKSCN